MENDNKEIEGEAEATPEVEETKESKKVAVWGEIWDENTVWPK